MDNIDNPELYFQTKLYTGDGSATQAQTFDGSEDMQPDWVWIKSRSNAEAHSLTDSVRGVTKWLESNSTAAEQTNANTMKAFGTDGFSVGLAGSVGDTGQTYVAWCWKAGTTSGITTNGATTITPSPYSFNADAGFAILKYAGNGTAGAKVAHGMGKVPKFIITKRIDEGAESWTSYTSVTGNTKFINFNSTGAPGTATNRWNDTDPDTVNFTLGSEGSVNASGQPLMAWCFADVQGYQKVGSYTGNANADGTFVYTGFSPSFVMARITSGTGNVNIFDIKRTDSGGGNIIDKRIKANSTAAEIDGTANQVDFLANGFKWRGTDDDTNISGGTFVYLAIAKSPFVNSSGVPNNAR